MNTELLEKLLREKIATEKPRPGFETRIQALAREPYVAEESHRFRWIMGTALAALILIVSLPRQPESQELTNNIVKVAPLSTVEATVSVAQTSSDDPVKKEIEGIKSDARRAFDFLSNAVPSMTRPK